MTDDATPTLPPDAPPPAPDAAATAAYPTTGDGPSGAPAGRPSWRERVLGIRGVIAVGLASFILGGLGGAAVTALVNDDDDRGPWRHGPGWGDWDHDQRGPGMMQGPYGQGWQPYGPNGQSNGQGGLSNGQGGLSNGPNGPNGPSNG